LKFERVPFITYFNNYNDNKYNDNDNDNDDNDNDNDNNIIITLVGLGQWLTNWVKPCKLMQSVSQAVGIHLSEI
jgi:hypothetical protein